MLTHSMSVSHLFDAKQSIRSRTCKGEVPSCCPKMPIDEKARLQPSNLESCVLSTLIKQARQSGQLNLSNKSLPEVPLQVWRINIDVPDDAKDVSLDNTADRWWQQTDLRKLILASNQIKTLSPEVRNLPALNVLDIHDNKLEMLPEELSTLTELSKLSSSHNLLRSLPDSLVKMPCLKVLLLSNNQIRQLHTDFGDLENLEELDLSHNKLLELPASFGNLKALRNLNLSHNCLKDLPFSITNLSALGNLELQNNKLTTLPLGIENMKLLRIMNCRTNLLATLPPLNQNFNVKEIYLGGNRLKHLAPELFTYLPSVVTLDVKDNTLQSSPSLFRTVDLLNQKFKIKMENDKDNESKNSLLDINVTEMLQVAIRRIELLEKRHLQHVQPSSSDIGTLVNLPGPSQPYQSNPSANANNADNSRSSVNTYKPTMLQRNNSILPSLLTSGNNFRAAINEDFSIPDEITLLKNLERLDIRNNSIPGLPAIMGNMESIKSLSLDGNPLRGIRRDIVSNGTQSVLKYLRSRIKPTDETSGDKVTASRSRCDEPNSRSAIITTSPDDGTIHQIRASRKIEFSNKQALSVPEVYFVEGHITSVDFSKNALQQVPSKLINYKCSLTDLNLSFNKLTHFPVELAGLESLKFLDLGCNMLSSLPPECCSWKSLIQIVLSGNRFQTIPELLYSIESLEVLLVASNQINEIDVTGLLKLKRISSLDLSNNNIHVVPPQLGNVSTLKSLHIEGNPFRNPRHAILLKGTPHLLAYLRDRIPT